MPESLEPIIVEVGSNINDGILKIKTTFFNDGDDIYIDEQEITVTTRLNTFTMCIGNEVLTPEFLRHFADKLEKVLNS